MGYVHALATGDWKTENLFSEELYTLCWETDWGRQCG